MAPQPHSPRTQSPLTRGKHLAFTLPNRHVRLIPAHAGKTKMTDALTAAPPAHPRSRGENTAIARTVTDTMGSSPLTRGKRLDRAEHRADPGLIPAHAGKTTRIQRRSGTVAAHPRSRGENRELKQDDTGACGSSPLTRGKLAGATVSAPIPRLIPAHAGKTSRGHERLPS